MISRNKEFFLEKYKELDYTFNTYMDTTYEKLVNFSQIRNKPIHRWFYFQEGYSPELVVKLIKHLDIKNYDFIFDPFAGSGTTLLTAKELGVRSMGFEINPFSVFMIKAKTTNYNIMDLKLLKEFKIQKYYHIPKVYSKYELKIIKNLFKKENLEKIEIIKKEIKKIKNEKSKNLLFAGLLAILEDVSNYRKGGNGLKRKRINEDKDPFKEFHLKINQIYEDLIDKPPSIEPIIIQDSCLKMNNYLIEGIDLSIFSPPYANCFDPFEVYKIELWIGEFIKSYKELRTLRKLALPSNLNANLNKQIKNKGHRFELLNNIIHFLSKKDLWDRRIPKMLDLYFSDMYFLLNSIYRKTSKGGYCVIVIGNSAYGTLVVPTDIILAQIGKKVGFNVEGIIVARYNETSSQQHAKLGELREYVRESLVVLRK